MGDVNKKKAIPFSLFFLKYFFCFCAVVVLIAFGALSAFNVLAMKNIIYPANHAQKLVEEAYDKIAASPQIDESMIPDLCQYAVLDKEGTMTAGNLPAGSVKSAREAVQEKKEEVKGSYYSVIPREDEYCVLKYQIVPQYRSSALRQYLPNPQNLILIIALLLMLCASILIAIRFGRTLRRKLHPLLSATEKMQRQELDFTIQLSRLKEVDTILVSMEQMRAQLKESLQRQWRLEQSRKEQMAALAHDLKTPLTILRGNTDLLAETELSLEQEECWQYIRSSTLQMEDYIKALIELAQAENKGKFEICEVETGAFLSKVRAKLEGLLAAKRIALIWETYRMPEKLYLNEDYFSRALLNIVSNAVDFTPQEGIIAFQAVEKDSMIEFVISDSGPGFSPKALANAAKQFYMEDESRSSSLHYGMGLYIADTIARNHQGTLSLANSKEYSGAEVTISAPL